MIVDGELYDIGSVSFGRDGASKAARDHEIVLSIPLRYKRQTAAGWREDVE